MFKVSGKRTDYRYWCSNILRTIFLSVNAQSKHTGVSFVAYVCCITVITGIYFIVVM